MEFLRNDTGYRVERLPESQRTEDRGQMAEAISRRGMETIKKEDAVVGKKMKVCRICKKEKEVSEVAAESAFSKHPSSADGYDSRCKECKSDQVKALAKKKREAGLIAEKKPASKRVEKTESAQEPQAPLWQYPVPVDIGYASENPMELVLDFTGYPELLEEVKALAKREVRTVELQALWMVKTLAEVVAQ